MRRSNASCPRQSPAPERAERLGTLVASGLIVGESPFGLLNAGLIVSFSNDAPLALVPATFAPAKVFGLLGFVGLVVWLHGWRLRKARGQTAVEQSTSGPFVLDWEAQELPL